MKPTTLPFLIFLLFGTAWADESISFTSADDQNLQRAKFVNELLTTCFDNLGMKLNVVPMPSKRSLHDANVGNYAGNFVRTKGISAVYSNLVIVPEPLAQNVIVAFSKKNDIHVNGWSSLLPYHVAWVRGWRNCERELSSAKGKHELDTAENLFRFLDKERADIGVFGLETGLQILSDLEITNLKPLTPPIVTSDLYLYLNKKYAHLVSRIVKELRKMKKDGTYDKIRGRHYLQ